MAAPDPDRPKEVRDAALEEARRLFYPQQMTIKDAYGANVAFKTTPRTMANRLPSRFLGELGPVAPKPIAGGA